MTLKKHYCIGMAVFIGIILFLLAPIFCMTVMGEEKGGAMWVWTKERPKPAWWSWDIGKEKPVRGGYQRWASSNYVGMMNPNPGENALTSQSSNDRKFWIYKKLTDVNAVRVSPDELRVYNPKVMYNIRVEAIDPEGIHLVNKEGRKETLPYDTLIISRGRQPVDSLFDQLAGKVQEIYKIGDCSKVANIQGAVWSANEVARKI